MRNLKHVTLMTALIALVASQAIVLPARAAGPDPLLIAYYPLDGNGDDESGHGRNLQSDNDVDPKATKYSPGKFGKAVGIPTRGYGGWGLTAKPATHFPASLESFTFMAWVCVYNLDIDNAYIGYVTNLNIRFQLKAQADTPGVIDYWYSTSDMNDADAVFSNGRLGVSAINNETCQTWNHVAVTFERPNSLLSFYLNGNLDSAHPINMSSTATMSNLFYGDISPVYSAIDDFAFFAFDLSAEQIKKVYSANQPLSKLLPLKPVTGANDWVNAHNRYRHDLPAYDNTKSTSPNLQWDATLAGMAQKWANHLATKPKGTCDIFHSKPGFFGSNTKTYGENINMFSFPVSAYDSIDAYVNSEKHLFDPKTSTCSCPRNQLCCGHYTQIISQYSTQLGCAQAVCTDGPTEHTISVCTYRGPGNIVSGGVFDELYPKQQKPYGGAPSKTYSEIMRFLVGRSSPSSLTWNADLAKAAADIKTKYSNAANGSRPGSVAATYAPGFSQYWVCDIGSGGSPTEFVAAHASKHYCPNVVDKGPLVGMAVTEVGGQVRSVMVFGKQ